MRRIASGVGIVALALVLAGCATSRQSDDEILAEVLAEYLASSEKAVPAAGRDIADVAPHLAPRTVETATARTEASRDTTDAATKSSRPAPTSGDATLAADQAEPGNPAPSAALQQGTVTIQPDTVLRITVEEDTSLNGTYRVDTSGAIQFKYVGLLFLDNLTVDQARARIRERLEGAYVRSATVGVDILQASYDTIQVIGMVNNPGVQRIGAGSAITLREALLRANGVKGMSSHVRARVVRRGMLDPLLTGSDGEIYGLVGESGSSSIPEIQLRNKDLVQVFEHKPGKPGAPDAPVEGGARVLLLGEVERPGYVAFGPGEQATMLQLALKINGFSRWARANKIEVVRSNGNGLRETYTVDADKVLKSGLAEDDFALENGDIVRVPTRSFSFDF